MRTYDWTPTAARSATGGFDLAAAHGAEGITVAAAVDGFIEAAQAGRAVNRSGRPYMPSALRDVRGILDYHVVPELGAMRLRDVRRTDIQRLVDRLGADQLSESRIRSVISALRALYGYAIDQGQAEFNPADGLLMPEANERVRRPPDDLRDDRPPWDDPPPRAPRQREPREHRPRDHGAPPRREASPPRQREREAYEPIAQLPERILSFSLKAVFVLLVLVVIVSLLESL